MLCAAMLAVEEGRAQPRVEYCSGSGVAVGPHKYELSYERTFTKLSFKVNLPDSVEISFVPSPPPQDTVRLEYYPPTPVSKFRYEYIPIDITVPQVRSIQTRTHRLGEAYGARFAPDSLQQHILYLASAVGSVKVGDNETYAQQLQVYLIQKTDTLLSHQSLCGVLRAEAEYKAKKSGRNPESAVLLESARVQEDIAWINRVRLWDRLVPHWEGKRLLSRPLRENGSIPTHCGTREPWTFLSEYDFKVLPEEEIEQYLLAYERIIWCGEAPKLRKEYIRRNGVLAAWKRGFFR